MSSEIDKLAIQTADLAIATHKQVKREKQRVDKFADVAGERVRAAEIAARFQDWATGRLSPRRRRHEKLAAFDERVAELEARRSELLRTMNETRERIPAAGAEHQAALTRWHAEGAKGPRPESPLPALDAELRRLQEDYDALAPLIDETLAEKVAWVETHRGALERDAAAAVQEAAAEYRLAVDRLVEAREELVAARKDETWAKLFPDASLGNEPPNAALVGGIPARMRQVVPGLKITIGMPELRRLLEADIAFVQEMVTSEQQEALRARDPEAMRLDREAIWTQTEAGQEALRRERREARERYEREWGQKAPW